MKDLLVVLEGRDDKEVMRAVLNRPNDLGIRTITFELDRRSRAVPTQEPDLARDQRKEFQFAICLWDHVGSPYENERPAQAQGKVQARLNQNTLRDCSKALVIDPELEIWLWQDQAAIATVLEVNAPQLIEWLDDWQKGYFPDKNIGALIEQFPKEALEAVFQRAKEKPSAALYRRIASEANLGLWSQASSFQQMRRALRKWFPRTRKAARAE
jgi:hypothetical protein